MFRRGGIVAQGETIRALAPRSPARHNRPMRPLLSLPALALLAPAVAAHPHIFIDASHELIFDAEGRLSGVRATWSYDEMFSLLMVEDGGYDADKDGAISGAELAAMQLWDADWPEDFGGDLEVLVGGQAQALARPSDWAADWRDGRAVSVHTRALKAPVAVKEAVIRVFDPAYYTAYTIAQVPALTAAPKGCKTETFAPDPEAVSPELAAAYAELSAEQTPEGAGLPEMGGAFAEEIRLTCD